MKIKTVTFVISFLLLGSYLFSQGQLSQNIVDAYQEEGWFYVGGSTFIYGEKEDGYGNPKVLALNIDQASSTAMLFLYEYDCPNKRIMMLAYKRYQNKPVMEKEHYLFDHLKEWDYPLKTSISDLMMQLVCNKFSDSSYSAKSTMSTQTRQSTIRTKNFKSTYTYSPILDKPKMSGNNIGKVENERVEILEKTNSDFFKVRSGNTIGYLWKGWIK